MMDAKTLEALKGSIAKWEAIVAGTGKDGGASNCPLCKIFLLPHKFIDEEKCCMGCPVFEHTKTRGCGGTPFEQFEDCAPEDEDGDRYADTDELAAVAQAELDFLKSLLPK